MTQVVLDISMSLDGFVAQPDDRSGPIHEWFFEGETVNRHNPIFNTTPESDAVLDETLTQTGAVVAGRRTYDFTNGWGGSPPLGGPYFIVTHTPPAAADVPEGNSSFTFVSGVEAAIDQAAAAAGDKNVCIMGGAGVAAQAIAARRVDRVLIHLTPVLLGEGVRLIDSLDHHVRLAQTRVVAAPDVTHLFYDVVG